MFQNDFEDVAGDSFPFHGWTAKVQDTSSTWKQYTYYNWKNEGNDSKLTLTSATTGRVHRMST